MAATWGVNGCDGDGRSETGSMYKQMVRRCELRKVRGDEETTNGSVRMPRSGDY